MGILRSRRRPLIQSTGVINVSRSHKLKWRKIINQLRYTHKELDIVKEMSTLAAPEFQEYYEDFCKRNDIDLNELNRKNAERIENVYGANKEKVRTIVPYSGSTEIVSYEGNGEQPTYEEAIDDNGEIHSIFSKLFKKLAVVLHPDKLANKDLTDEEKNDMLDMFTKAKWALEERKYFLLVDYAEKLKIPLPKNYKEQIFWMKKELIIIQEKIKKEVMSYNYLFSESETAEAKDKLIEQFLGQLFQIKLT